MGMARRWLRSLLTGRKDSRDANESAVHRREKQRRSFSKSTTDVEEGAAPAVPACARRSFQAAGTEDERSKRAASAVAAAARAAVAVVRPTDEEGHGLLSGGARERRAATAIQTVFRGFLARKALRALRALVRLQALVRGYLVRRQAMAALHSMQALARAQLTARIRRIRLLRPRRSLELFDEVKGQYAYDGRRPSSAADYAVGAFDGSPRLVEIGPGARRPSYQWACEAGDPPPANRTSAPHRLGIFLDSNDWCLTGDECRSSTAQSTPRFTNRSGGAAAITAPQNFPNYMTKTQSFESKARCQSAPKQRSDPAGARRRTALCNGLEKPRRSLGGARMQRSCSQVQDSMEFKAAVVGRLDQVVQLGSRAAERGLPSKTRW